MVAKYIERVFDNLPSLDWDLYAMRIAKEVAQNSKCLSRSIGAVLVRDKSVISTGYNGPPRGVPECWNRNPNYERKCPRQVQGYKSGEGLDLCIAGHAERNAIVNAARFGIETRGTSLVCYCGIPCKDCLIEVINAGIIEIVYKKGSSTGVAGDDYYDRLSPYLVQNSDILVRGIKFD
ncbi:MAG: deoxycytidylate deaminase [Candidatus Hodarchaeales archaeon]|jgi:dCMP deaminase